jgi:hypothetical protein
VAHFLGLAASFRLPDLPLPFPGWYLFIKNGLWGIIGLAVAAGLFFCQSWAPSFARWSGVSLMIWYWLDRLLLAQSDFAQRAWPAVAVVSLLIITGLLWTLNRPTVQDFFMENTS